MLNIYAENLDEYIDDITAMWESRDIRSLTIKIHAVKSTTRSIGAKELGEQAQKLENAGNDENINALEKGIPGFNGISKIAFTYLLVTIGQFIFRSPSISEAFSIIKHIPFSCNGGLFYDLPTMANAFICIVVLLYVDIKEEWFGNKYLKLPKHFEHWRWDLTIAIGIVVILLFGVFDNNQFIYFQF